MYNGCFSNAAKPKAMEGIVLVEGGKYAFKSEMFLKFFPEFSSIEENYISTYGTLSVALLNAQAFGVMFNTAAGLFTAHRLARIFDLSQNYEDYGMADQSSSDITTSVSASTSSLAEGSSLIPLANSEDPYFADLAATKYGLLFLHLLKVWIPGGYLVRGGRLASNSETRWPMPISRGDT